MEFWVIWKVKRICITSVVFFRFAVFTIITMKTNFTMNINYLLDIN